MNSIFRLKFLFVIFSVILGQSVLAADLNIDFMKNRAFENNLYQKPAPTEVTLFKDKDKKEKKSKKVEVEHYDNTSPESLNITDKEFIEKYKKAHYKKTRKQQFDITIEKNNSDTLTDEQNKMTGDADTKEDNSAKTYDPSNKTFFSDNAKGKTLNKKKSKKNKKNAPEQTAVPSNLILTADVTEYYPERNEIEALGNAKLEITGENFELYGDKIVFNHDTNCVRAYDNVKIIQGEDITSGDFINMDMNTAHGWIQKPVSSNYSIRIKANEAYVFPDKIEEYEGVANVMEDKRFSIGSGGYSSLLEILKSNVADYPLKKPEPTAMKFKVKSIDVESKDGHNVITMKNIGIYYKKFKIGVLPRLRLVTDKEQTVMQTNLPELGSDSNMGMYFGPSIVLNTPLSSTLKISPLLIYSQDESKFGIGGAATFMSGSNITEMAYGSAENKFMLRGMQKITPHLNLNYSQNTYTSQWFLGYRRPMYSAELEYTNSYYIKDLGVNFEHNLSAGMYSDYARLSKMAEGRIRWMTQLQKNFYSYTNSANTFSLDLGVVGQGVVSQYTSGDTLGIARIAPSITTTYKGWSQNLMYFQSGASGSTPFLFDDYYYGRSTLQVFETLRVNKYLSLGYLATMALGGRETYSAGRYNPGTGNFLQENMFLVSIGPDEAKVIFTYDAYRKSTAVYFSMLLGSKDMDVAFKKATIHNPDTIMGENKKIPAIKDTFNKVRYKVFPLTNPAFNRATDLYPQENRYQENVSEDVDEAIDKEEERIMKEQLKQQLNPILQNQELMKDTRM